MNHRLFILLSVLGLPGCILATRDLNYAYKQGGICCGESTKCCGEGCNIKSAGPPSPVCDVISITEYPSFCAFVKESLNCGCSGTDSTHVAYGKCPETADPKTFEKGTKIEPTCDCSNLVEPYCDTKTSTTYMNWCRAVACGGVDPGAVLLGECTGAEAAVPEYDGYDPGAFEIIGGDGDGGDGISEGPAFPCTCSQKEKATCDTKMGLAYGNRCTALCAGNRNSNLQDGDCPKESKGSGSAPLGVYWVDGPKGRFWEEKGTSYWGS